MCGTSQMCSPVNCKMSSDNGQTRGARISWPASSTTQSLCTQNTAAAVEGKVMVAFLHDEWVG